MTKKSIYTKAENEAWLAYDSSFNDSMDNVEVEDFKDLENDSVPKNTWGQYGDYVLVGSGVATNTFCGTFKGYRGCLNVDLHNHVSLDGISHSGNVFVKKVFQSCDKPLCPICYRSGWAVREATAIEDRIKEAQKRFGMPEHVVVSIPSCDYGLDFPKMRVKTKNSCYRRGILGGVMIFHAFRYRNYFEAFIQRKEMGWYWSPHFHILGFIDGGYRCCRKCSNAKLDKKGSVRVINTDKCLACKVGFEGRTRREYFKEGGLFGVGGGSKGYIVKVQGKRKTVHGTAWYQLNHCSIVKGSSRAHAVYWFGVCSYVKLKLKKGDRIKKHDVCPICGYELEAVKYVGDDEQDPVLTYWIREWEEPFFDKNGAPKWILAPKVVNNWRR